MSYAGLRYYSDTSDALAGKFLGDCQARVTDISGNVVFMTLELNGIEEDALAAKLASSPALDRYRPWLGRLRAMKPYQLSDELERFLHDQSVVGSSAWVRLYDETLASLRFDVQGQDLTLEATLTLMSDGDRAKREAAGHALAKVFGQNLALFSRVTNTLAKDKEVDDRWRSLPAPDSSRHLANHVEAEVVDALREAVTEAYPRLSHRYYALKAKWLGLEKLEYWDRNAPLPEKDDRRIPWDEAQETVLSAYGSFSPDLADLAKKFFDNAWIDAPVRPGKASGAFAHPTVVSCHPYVLVNYLGKTRDVMTLAHELGHGVHQLLAAEQGELLSQTPLTLAETASVFGEMLTFQSLLAKESDPGRRKALLAGKVEDMLNTVVRQIAFYEFELRVHAERRAGELTAERIGEIWMEVAGESLGPAVNLADGYETYWTYVSHFIHAPFYVYAYAFGDGLVNALYARYQDGDPGFQQRYFDMLRAGGAKHHSELLAPFGLDAADPAFWGQGLGLIESMIDELEAMG
jgi:oligoendopeptidase F